MEREASPAPVVEDGGGGTTLDAAPPPPVPAVVDTPGPAPLSTEVPLPPLPPLPIPQEEPSPTKKPPPPPLTTVASTSSTNTNPNSWNGAFRRSSGESQTQTPTQPQPTGWTKKSGRRIVVGVCARDKKVRSKAMTEILSRFDRKLFEVVIFGDKCILEEPVERWPYCDALIAFYSTGFPLDKVDRYVDTIKPFILNDLKMQRVLHDRRKVYDLLQHNNIDVPVHAYLNRDGPDADKQTLEEFDEYILVNGIQINKPLVEKPVDAEDHNVYIYYPMSMGGGSKRLFRKVGDRSSEFYPDINEVRQVGSYIYEEFVETQGTDVKVYTVGPDYGHAEARKSPVVDGKVNRNEDGKEVRYPVILSAAEKEIARKVCTAFKQTVCGFDLLRVQGRSYVCDVNGWSFVKNSRKYYDDCAQLLSEFIIAALEPGKISGMSAIGPLLKRSGVGVRIGRGRHNSITSPKGATLNLPPPRAQRTDSPDAKDRQGDNKEELRCVIAVIRHGDRTPKQKMKMMTSWSGYLEFYHKYSAGDCRKDVKSKSKQQLLEFLAATRKYIEELQYSLDASGGEPDMDLLYKLIQVRDVLERSKIAGFNRKLQLKPRSFEKKEEIFTSEEGVKEVKVVERCSELLVILKWGGDLTKLGERQAERLGNKFTKAMYPDPTGGGILRLHSTFRHDLKIKASDEGRVMKTAAAFAKGMLELEGELTPILVSLVQPREKNTIHMLDPSGNLEVKKELEECKHHLHQMMQQDIDLSEEQIDQVVLGGQKSIKRALRAVKNPRKTLFRMRELINFLVQQLEQLVKENGFMITPVSRNGSYSTLSSFLSATLLGDQNTMEPPVSLNSIGSGLNSSGGSKGELGLGKMGSGGGSAENTAPSTPMYAPDMARGGELSSSLNGGGRERDRRRGSSCTDYDPYYRFDDGDTRSVGGDEEPDMPDYKYFRNPVMSCDDESTPASRAESVVLAVEDLPRSNSNEPKPHGGETLLLMLDRWKKLYKDLYNSKTDNFDLSKVPDVHDNIRYDMLHNSHLGLRGMEELHDWAKFFADCIVPQEYGVDREEKRVLGSHMCQALLEKIKYDLIIARANDQFDVRYNLDLDHAPDLPINSIGRRVRSRLYFTSESHLHTLLNVLRFPEEGQPCCFTEEGIRVIENTSELCYLTHVVLRMFEDFDKEEDDPRRFRIEILFSPGVTAHPYPADLPNSRHTQCEPLHVLNPGMTVEDLNTCLENAMKIGRVKASLARMNAKKTAAAAAESNALSATSSIDLPATITPPMTPAKPTTKALTGGEDELMLEQGPYENGDGGMSIGSNEEGSRPVSRRSTPAPSPSKPEGRGSLVLQEPELDAVSEDEESDDLAPEDIPLPNVSRAGSFSVGTPSSALLSAAVVAAASVIGGVMLLRK